MAPGLHGRKHTDPTSGGGIHKRGKAPAGGPVGNTGGYSGRQGFSGPSRSGGRPGSLLAILLMLLLAGGGSLFGLNTLTGDGGASGQGQPQSPSYSQQTGGGPQLPSVSYEDGSTSALDETVAPGVREKYTSLAGNGSDTVTILVYMCGADLESRYGMATTDLQEMAAAADSDQVRILVQTGGARHWKNTSVSPSTCQRWRVTDRGLKSLDDSVGDLSMTDPSVLADFIRWGSSSYPADRTSLIFWDHGGGSVTGYGYDENHPGGSMEINEIYQALKAGGQKFDWIGFDACLMANAETACALAPFSDYMIASEETEPGTGWYYTDWLSQLAENPSIQTTKIGKKIIDDYMSVSRKEDRRSALTLSLVDLAEFSHTVPAPLARFGRQLQDTAKTDSAKDLSKARSVTREFAPSSKIDQVDLVHFCRTSSSSLPAADTAHARALEEAILGCVKYNRTSNMSNAYGLSIYFPYRQASKVAQVAGIYDEIGMDAAYRDAVKSFATLEGSGQIAAQQTSSPIFDMLGGAGASSGSPLDLSALLQTLLSSSGSAGSGSGSGLPPALGLTQLLGGSSGIDASSLEDFSQLIGRNHIDSQNLVFTRKGGQTVLQLPQDQWDQIQQLALNVWIDDGQGYIDLGLDDVYSFDKDGALIIDYDNTWPALNGQPCAYYVTSEEFRSEEDYTIRGYIPVMIESSREEFSVREARLIVEFTDEIPSGTILGAQYVYEEGTEAKGLHPVENGSRIQLLCDYYDYQGNYQDSYYLSDPIQVGEEGLNLSTYQIQDEDLIYGYQLKDIYQAAYYTPMTRVEG